MTLDQILLFPLTHRMVTEAQISTYELGLAGLAEYIERHSATRLLAAPVLVKATKRARRTAKGR